MENNSQVKMEINRTNHYNLHSCLTKKTKNILLMPVVVCMIVLGLFFSFIVFIVDEKLPLTVKKRIIN